MTLRATRLILAAILALYLVLGSLYAFYTPAWQAPDEPAHYNYVRYLAENGSFPVLHPGDYPHEYLEQIKHDKFPPGMPVDNIRYESHQPPLYYAMAAPVFKLFGTMQGPWATPAPGLLALRLFSVLLGLPLVLLAYAITRRIFPYWPALALGVGAFVAFLPRHLASAAQAGNDPVSELLLALVLLVLADWLLAPPAGQAAAAAMSDALPESLPAKSTEAATAAGQPSVAGQAAGLAQRSAGGDAWDAPAAARQAVDHAPLGGGNGRMADDVAASSTKARWGRPPAARQPAGADPRRLLLLGLLLGLIAITKTTAYFALALILGVMAWDWRRRKASLASMAGELCLVGLPAALLALPWYARDVSVYGWPDFLGLRMHDTIVTGQMRPADFLAQYGLVAYLRQLIVVTFESFWAVFGWQGAFLDVRIYEALGLLSAVAAGGLLLWWRQTRRGPGLSHRQRRALCLLLGGGGFAVLTYAWYNTQFVQFQGRYLFTGLIPAALAFALGWAGATRPARHGRVLAAALLLLAALLAAVSLSLAQSLPKFPLALLLGLAALLATRSALPARVGSRPAVDAVLFALPYFAMPLFAIYCLFAAIVPQLR